MNIFIASDHGGFELKQQLVAYLKEKGMPVRDEGPETFTEGDDYPDLISRAAEKVSGNPDKCLGIIIGLSGQGEAIVANKFKGVRAGVYTGGSLEIPKLLREHNNANMLSLGAKFITTEEAKRAVDVFIATAFPAEERHVRRINKITALEERM